MTQSIYQKYGGYNTIYKIIVELYEELCDHPEIAQHFIGVDLERLIKLQTQYVSRALGADIEYNGRPLHRVHIQMPITDFQYTEVEKVFTKLFTKNGFEPQDVRVVKELLIGERVKIVSAKWSIIDSIMKPFYFVINYFEGILKKRGSLVE